MKFRFFMSLIGMCILSNLNAMITPSDTLERITRIYREKVKSGNESAKSNLAALLSNYAVWLFDGEHGIEKDTLKAIKICREAVKLGDVESQKSCQFFLITIPFGFLMVSAV